MDTLISGHFHSCHHALFLKTAAFALLFRFFLSFSRFRKPLHASRLLFYLLAYVKQLKLCPYARNYYATVEIHHKRHPCACLERESGLYVGYMNRTVVLNSHFSSIQA